MPLTDPIFGPLLGPSDIEFAVLNTLEAWVPYMLRVLERRHSFPPGHLNDPAEYSGGIDFESWDEDHLPSLIVVIQPDGDADRASAYNQWVTVEVGAIVSTEKEDESRIRAGHLATAAAAALVQHGDLGGIASRTALVTAIPILEFPDPEARLLVRARTTLRTYITGIVDDLAGTRTATPPESPHVPSDDEEPSTGWPEHTTTTITVEGL